jgi:4-hydroxybenzoate polyprenyltransferase
MNKTFSDFLVISRANIQVASLPTALIGCVLGAERLSDVWNVGVLLYVALFFTVLTFACNVNCLADADVDAMHKARMSEAVRSLGKGRIKMILAIEAFAAVGLAAGLAVLRKDAVLLLGAGTLSLAFIYSAPPLRIKGRGWLSPFPVAFGLYALPPLGGWYLVHGRLDAVIVVFALGYAALMEGLTIVNTCEDHPEDEAAGVRTLAHVLGIRQALSLGAWLAGTGGVVALGTLLLGPAWGEGRPGWLSLAGVGALTLVFAWTVGSIIRALRQLAGAGDPAAACKVRARSMPAWFLRTRYPLLFIALLLKG